MVPTVRRGAKRSLVLLLLLLPVAASLPAEQATSGDPLGGAAEVVELLYPLQYITALGISPFLALSVMGLGSFYWGTGLPPALEFLGHPIVWGALLVLAVALGLGRTSKVIKPVAELLGTAESATAIVALVALFLGSTGALALGAAGEVQQAGVLGTGLLLAASLSALLVVVTVRMGFDLLTWLSPVPFIDGLLQLAKSAVTIFLVAVAVIAPPVAVALNVALIVGFCLALRWLIRVGGFAVRVLWDAGFGRFRRWPLASSDAGLGPIPAFALGGVPGFGRLSPLELHWTVEGWWVCTPESADRQRLGGSAGARIRRGLIGSTLQCDEGAVFLTARLHRHLGQINRITGTAVESGSPVQATPSPHAS